MSSIVDILSSENNDGTPERVIVWTDSDADIIVTWNQSVTFQMWIKKEYSSSYEETNIWTSDTEVLDLKDAFKRASKRMQTGI